MRFTRGFLLLGLATCAAVGTAQARKFEWTNGAQNSAAGIMNNLTTTYDNNTQRLTFRATFGVVPNSPNLKTDGFWVALSGGPNPKGHGGELALLYFDATGNAPKLTAFNYNGVNGNTSYKDGSPASGNQAPDRIASSLLSTSWINSMNVSDDNGTRTMEFDIDATEINNHSPKYPGRSPWTGVAYGEKIGIWLHHTAGSAFSYQDGFVSDYTSEKQGWLDLSDCDTTPVPEPASMAVLGLGLAAVARRRNKKS